MTTQHTAGPWRVFSAFTDLEIVTDRPTAHETESIVQFKGQRNAKANARLIAAAPRMLEALKRLAYDCGNLDNPMVVEKIRAATLPQALAAIVQAEGDAA